MIHKILKKSGQSCSSCREKNREWSELNLFTPLESKHLSGFTLLEVIISLAIVSISLCVVLSLHFKNIHISKNVRDKVFATVLLSNRLTGFMLGESLTYEAEFEDYPYLKLSTESGDGFYLVKIKNRRNIVSVGYFEGAVKKQ